MHSITGQAKYPTVEVGFDLREEPGFTPPPGVAELRGMPTVQVDLARGAHYFFTCIIHRPPSYQDVEKFFEWTLKTGGPHCFMGSAFGDDSEYNIDLSKTFSKLVGIGFMASYAGSTWFASLSRKRWADGISSPHGLYTFAKVNPEDDGPDYLAAAFDPATDVVRDPLYALEFKGHAQRVDFDHAKFQAWRAQAANISCRGPDDQPRRMKSWVLAFNYAFAQGVGCRKHSTLLVDDPIVGPGSAQSLEPEGRAVEGIIRTHLARQCDFLGAGRLIPTLLLGREISPQQVFPRVYTVRHHRLFGRTYIGWFCSLGPNGQIIWSRGPTKTGQLDRSDIRVFVDGVGIHGFVRARARMLGGSSFDVDIRASGSWTISEAEHWIRSLFSGEAGGEIFVGQDATMLKECIATPRGRALGGEAFAVPVEFTQGASPSEGGFAVEVIRNGSLFADSRMVTPVDDPDEWWASQ